MSSSAARDREEEPSIEEVAIRPGISGVLAQSMLMEPVPEDISVTSDNVGIEPRSLVGKRVQSGFWFDLTLAHFILKMTDGTEVVLTYRVKHDPFWDEDKDEPELQLGEALESALKAITIRGADNLGSNTSKFLTIVAATAGEKTSRGWSPWLGDGDMGRPNTQKHRVLGLRFKGMDEMGWITSKRDVWDNDIECPHEITWADVILADSVGRSPKLSPY